MIGPYSDRGIPVKNLSPDALAWLKRLRDSANAGMPPPAVAAALTREGVARTNGKNFVITNKGREGLRATLPKPYDGTPKKYV
jgi:hypothetical protein